MTGSYYAIASLPEWRFRKLQEIGIDFRHEQFQDTVFTHLPHQDGQYPLLYSGILCSAIVSKGELLGAFLDHRQWQPDTVIFFDDSLKRLQEVETECVKRNISFVGFHYHGAECVKGELDKEIAAFQLQYLVEHEQWIMEDEAQMLLNAQKDQGIK